MCAGEVLVSFCNFEHERPSGLAWIRFNPFEVRWVTGRDDTAVNSATGITQNEAHLFVTGHRDKKTFLQVWAKRDYSLLTHIDLPPVHDAHSIVWHEQRLYIISTGSDSIYSIDPFRGLESLTVVIHANNLDRDTRHFNGLAIDGGRLLYSGFGEKEGESWLNPTNGFIAEVGSGRVVMEGLRHPHSIVAEQGELFFCESLPGLVRSNKGFSREFEGYTRGLAFLSDGKIAVGISKRRQRSKSTGIDMAVTGRGECKLILFDKDREESISEFDLSVLGDEIYDVVPVTHSPDARRLQNWMHAERSHARRTEQTVAKLREWGQNLDLALRDAQTALGHEAALAKHLTTWASSLENELRATQQSFKKTAEELAERTAWAASLADELRATQQSFKKTAGELAERTAWASSLTDELRVTQQSFKKTAEELAERTAWAASLENELRATQQSFEKTTEELVERTAWAHSLENELQQARTSFSEVAAREEQRARWAAELQRELLSTQQSAEKLSAEFAQRTEWALALQAELQASDHALKVLVEREDHRLTWMKSLAGSITAISQANGEPSLDSLRTAVDIARITDTERSLLDAISHVLTALGKVSGELEQARYAALVAREEFQELAAARRIDAGALAEQRLAADALESEVKRLNDVFQQAQQLIDQQTAELAEVRAATNLQEQRHTESMRLLRGQLEACDASLAIFQRSVIARLAIKLTGGTGAPRLPR